MPESNTPPPDPARLRRLIAAYEQRRSAGRAVDEADILRSYPDLAEGFQRYIERRARNKPTRLEAGGSDPFSPPVDASASDVRSDWLPPGTLVDRYRIKDVLGTGSMGIVYQAEDERLQRTVALKVPDIRGKQRDLFLKRFESEARVAAGLSHPSLCPILDFGTFQQQPFLTMPVLPGPSLAQFVELEGAQSPGEVVRLVRPIVEGLCEMHEHGITHRDLKPSNVLLDRRGRPVITDFGLARRDELSSDVRLTHASALMGSPAYCSPEQVRGDSDVGPTSDLYSLGVLMYELLTGRLPFEGSVGEVLGAVLHVSPMPPSQLRPSLPSRMEQLCLDLLHKEPAGRPQSASEVLKRLDDRNLLTEVVPTNRWLDTLRRIWKQRRTSLVAVAGLLLATVALAATLRSVDDPAESETPAPDSPPLAAFAETPSPFRLQDNDDLATTRALNPIASMPAVSTRVSGEFPTAGVPGLAPALIFHNAPDAIEQSRDNMASQPPAESVAIPGNPPVNLVAGSWLTATGKQDFTTWITSPTPTRWELQPEQATLLGLADLTADQNRALVVRASFGQLNGDSLWYPEPLNDFDFEFDLRPHDDLAIELVFRSFAPSALFAEEAIRVPLSLNRLDDAFVLKSDRPEDLDAQPPAVHFSGSIRGNDIRILQDGDIVYENRDVATGRPVDNWHAIHRSLPTRAYFGVFARSQSLQLTRMQIRPLASAAAATLKAPHVVQSFEIPTTGGIVKIGTDDWLQAGGQRFHPFEVRGFASRFSLANASGYRLWVDEDLEEVVGFANAPILGAAVNSAGTRVAFFGNNFVVADNLDPNASQLNVLDLPAWKHAARVFHLENGRFLCLQTPPRTKQYRIQLWEWLADGEPHLLAMLDVPKKLETLAASADGNRVIYTANGRLFTYRRDGSYIQQFTQRIPWTPQWSAISSDGQRLAFVVGPLGIWTAELVILHSRNGLWVQESSMPLAPLFWRETPPPTQRQFANYAIKAHSLEWSADATHLLGTFSQSKIKGSTPNRGCGFVWRVEGTTPLLRLPNVILGNAAFASDPQQCLVKHSDGVSRLWQLPHL